MATQQKKEEITDETLSLIHNYKEIKRLESELDEKKKHIAQLRQQGQVMILIKYTCIVLYRYMQQNMHTYSVTLLNR